jgi:GNAT superfamily N-acetyltransferase
MITIKEITSKADIKKFVKFPFELYKNNAYWVPPIIKDEIASFDKNENPVFENADTHFFLAYRDNKIVGRVIAIINNLEIEQLKINKIRFGWFDFIDDKTVSKALLDKVAEIGKQAGLEYMEGPMGFSNMDKVGVQTEGFDHIGSMVTWYNHPYYKEHLESFGYVVEKEYIESKFLFSSIKPELFQRIVPMLKKRYGYKALDFTKTSQIMPYIDAMFKLFNESYASLPSYVPITNKQVSYFKEKYLPFINPEMIKFVTDKEDNLIAFAITMPSFSRALQKAKGKLFPFGLFHLLKAKKHPEHVDFYLIGVHPAYQGKGVSGIIFDQFYKSYQKIGVKYCYRTPELTTNTAEAAIWKNFDVEIFSRRATYKKDL